MSLFLNVATERRGYNSGKTSDSAIFFSQQITNRERLGRTLELTNKLSKSRREKILAQFPVMLHSRRRDVMAKKAAPSLPDLLVHHTMDMVKMDRLERLEELIARMKEARLLLRRQRLQIL